MENLLLDFVALLRKGGMKIATSEICDALSALTLWGIREEATFYQLLKATLLKNQSDTEVFDLAYRLYFKGQSAFAPTPQSSACHSGDIPLKGTAGMNPKAKSFYGALCHGEIAPCQEDIDRALEAPLTKPCTMEELMTQLKVTLSWFMVENALHQTDNKEGLTTLMQLEAVMRQKAEEKLAMEEENGTIAMVTEENLTDKDFAALTEAQVNAMEQRIKKLGNKLAAKYSYRLKPAKYGSIDMRRVLAETAQRGYPPAQMHYLNKVKNRPSLLVLCDISGSMAGYSSFFLQLLYTMERSFREIQSFLFVENICKTQFPRKSHSVQQSIAAAVAEAYVPRTGRTGEQCTSTGVSDYGKVFYRFLQKFGDTLDRNTTVFLMGDAKSNWFAPNKEDFKTIAQRSKSVYWLNPEPRERWNKEDSIIGTYAPYCKGVYECRTLLQLEKVGQLLHQ